MCPIHSENPEPFCDTRLRLPIEFSERTLYMIYTYVNNETGANMRGGCSVCVHSFGLWKVFFHRTVDRIPCCRFHLMQNLTIYQIWDHAQITTINLVALGLGNPSVSVLHNGERTRPASLAQVIHD